ncbi:hypothetical protein CapIbe_001931 [Capra ibex]
MGQRRVHSRSDQQSRDIKQFLDDSWSPLSQRNRRAHPGYVASLFARRPRGSEASHPFPALAVTRPWRCLSGSALTTNVSSAGKVASAYERPCTAFLSAGNSRPWGLTTRPGVAAPPAPLLPGPRPAVLDSMHLRRCGPRGQAEFPPVHRWWGRGRFWDSLPGLWSTPRLCCRPRDADHCGSGVQQPHCELGVQPLICLVPGPPHLEPTPQDHLCPRRCRLPELRPRPPNSAVSEVPSERKAAHRPSARSASCPEFWTQRPCHCPQLPAGPLG